MLTTKAAPPVTAEHRALAREVNGYLDDYRRTLCGIHARTVESLPFPLLCLDDRFCAGYQMGLRDAARLLRKMGKE